MPTLDRDMSKKKLEPYRLKCCLDNQGWHEMLRNQDTLMRSGLLEQEGISRQGMKTGSCWNYDMQITPAEEFTRRGCGTYGIVDTQHPNWQRNNSVFRCQFRDCDHNWRSMWYNANAMAKGSQGNGYQALSMTEGAMSPRAADLREKIMAKPITITMWSTLWRCTRRSKCSITDNP